MLIFPAILFDDPGEAEMWVKKAATTEKYSRMQVDLTDGEYAPRGEIRAKGYEFIRDYKNIKFDAHLMVVEKNIDEYYGEAREAGFDRIIVQMESISHPEKYPELSIDVHSPVRVIEPILARLSYINVMSIEPGFGGQKFEDRVTEKIEQLGQLRGIDKYQYKICVDGGVEKGYLQRLEDLGADEVVVGVKRLLQW